MAKSKTKSTMGRNTKITIAIIVILVVAIALGMLWRYGQELCWFGHDYGEEEGVCVRCGKIKPVEDDKDAAANGGMIVEGSLDGRLMVSSRAIPREQYAEYGVSPLAENAMELTATITPVDASNQLVTWAVRWKNASSAWANGKTVTNYVTVNPSSDGALTATVSCLKAFGEQVEIVVTSRDNPEASAICTADYMKRLLDISFNTVTVNNLGTFAFTYNATYSDYTIDGDLYLVAAGGTIALTDNFKSSWRNNASSGFVGLQNVKDGKCTTNLSAKTITLSDYDSTDNYTGLVGCFASSADNKMCDLSLATNGLIKTVNSSTEAYHASIAVVVGMTVNGKTLGGITTSIPVKFDVSAMSIAVENVGLAPSSLAF